MSLGVPEVSPWVSVWSLYAIPNALGSLHSQSFGGVGGVSVLSLRVPEPPPPGQVDVVVTTAGGVEEDLIKCLAPTYVGDFSLKGRELRQNGINRCGDTRGGRKGGLWGGTGGSEHNPPPPPPPPGLETCWCPMITTASLRIG